MFKNGKKIVSIILTVCLMCSVFSVNAFAVSNDTSDNQSIQTDIGNDMSVKSTNSFGSLLTSELEQEAGKQEENNGINIFSVDVTDKTATVEFETLQDSTLVVAVYDESGVEMLASGKTEVTKDDTTAEVTIDTQSMPEYFYLRAFLVDDEVYRPLCTAYESPNYTKEMQEFFEKTTDDFADDRVLNLDNDKTNNFAVYDDDTKIIEQNGNSNQVASIDEESKIYVIENADSSITSLETGDIFAYNYGDDEILIIKIKSISVDGTTATIYGDETTIEEVFEYVKIDETADLSQAEYDPSTCGEGVTYNGVSEEEEVNPQSVRPFGVSYDGNVSTTYNFSFEKEKDDIKIKGSLDFGVTASVKVYVSFSYQYLELKLDYSAKLSASISLHTKDTLPLGYICISPFAGVIIEFSPSIVVECNGIIEISGTLKGTLGLKASNSDGIQNISTNPQFKPEIKAEIKLFIGISLEPEVKILSDLIKGKMDATLGAEIKATMSNMAEDTSKQIHECNACIKGEIYAKASLSFEIQFIKSEKFKFNFNAADIKVKIFDFYFSYTFADFDFTACPHQKYKVTITVKDSSGNAVSGATVNDKYITDDVGKADFFLSEGKYTITAKQGKKSGKAKLSVDGKPASITIIIVKNSADEDLITGGGDTDVGDDDNNNDNYSAESTNLSLGNAHSAYITENGDLYMWGWNSDGQLGDGTRTDRHTPTKIMSNVKAVSLGWGHGGAITENGDLYMWGNNYYGQLGDGTTTNRYVPTKIMSNVKAVNLGCYYSGAITESGDLYMWGDNYDGQLGDGTTTDRYIPTKIMSNVKTVSLGNYHSGAITENGDLYMWGWNGHGQLGDGTTGRHIPTKIMSNVKSVSLGWGHSGAITKNGDLYMWGYNWDGQVGDGTTTERHSPTKIMSNVKSVGLEWSHSGAITENGDLYTWGWNYYGQLGDGTTTERHSPTKIMSNVKVVSLGFYHSGAITENGDLYMWGYNWSGQLGDGTTTDRNIPTKITIPSANTKSVKSVLAVNSYKTEDFTDLLPNEVYNFYSMKTQEAENPFGSVNLLYITQTVTDENGNLSLTYIPDESYDNAVSFVVPLKQTDLSTATVTMDNLTYSGEEQYVAPIVTLNSKTLVEDADYTLSGDYFAKDVGNYTVTINGRGLYTGEVDFEYSVSDIPTNPPATEPTEPPTTEPTVIEPTEPPAEEPTESEEPAFVLGDVNGDGTVDAKDRIQLSRFLAKWSSVPSINEAASDLNADGVVDSKDRIILTRYLAKWSGYETLPKK